LARVPSTDAPAIDPFRGKHSSGLRDDFDATITEQLFTYDSQYNNGASLVAKITLRDDTAEPEVVEKFGEEEVLLLSTGNGMEDDAKGRKAKREDGKPMDAFQDTCNYMVFLNAALDCGAEDVIRGRGFMPWEAELLEGLRFHFMRQEYTPWNWNDKTDEEKAKGKPTRLLPTAFLGEEGGKAKTTSKAAAKEADDEPAEKAAPKAAASSSSGMGAAMKVKVKKIAKESDTHDEFMERVFSEIDGSDAYEDEIADDSDDGFYAQNHEG
jgi:hypothetical protein